MGARNTGSSLTVPALFMPGEVLAGKYRVETLLGTGGMGIVVGAVNVALEQRVAIKLLNTVAHGDGEIVSRFLREGRAAARLRSEHVARVLDFGTLPDGRPYLVTERLFGHDLAALIAWPGRIEIALAVDYVMQACDGLAEAHSVGIIHRDLKPANLFLTETVSGRPLVKVLDFGICKLESDDSAPLTAHNALLGTPRYMSPEQLQGARHADVRSDIWALGTILFELLTKTAPFEGASFDAQLDLVTNHAAPDISALRPDVPAELAAIIARCLAKDPAARFGDVLSLSHALEPFGLGRRPSTPIRIIRESDMPPAMAAPVGPSPIQSAPTVASGETPGVVEVRMVRRFGDYAMYETLGGGGMASVHFGVYLAPGGQPQPVALKVLRPELAFVPGSAATLIDEARLASAIRHHNVVGTVDALEAGGEIVLALEYVPGVSLAQALAAARQRGERVPLGIANAIALDALQGLEAIHDARDEHGVPLEIVHRDVSPQNILIDERGFARVTDFGIAKARGRLQTTTAVGAVKGKLGYLAPEQIEGQSSRALDVYAVGAVLWELLVGRPLVEGRDNERLAATLLGRFPRPSESGAASTPELDDLVMRALARAPADRPTVRAMADALVAIGPIATESEIAAWLDQMVHDELVRRHAMIAAMCSASSAPPIAGGTPALEAAHPAPRIEHARRRRIPIITLSVIGSFVLAATAYALVTRTPPPSPAIAPAPSAAEGVASASASTITITSASATTNEEPGSAPSGREKAPATRTTTAHPKAKRPDCSVPYTLDAQGRKVWKRECFAK